MALHLGNSQNLKVYFNGIECHLNTFAEALILDGILLLSLENFILKDTNGIYLTVKESE